MRRALFASILVFAAGSFLAVYLLTGDGPPRGREVAASPAGPSQEQQLTPPPALPAAPPRAADAASASFTPPKPMEYAPLPPPPPPGSWEAVRPVARLSALGPVGAAVRVGLQELGPRLSDCFDRPAPAREMRGGARAGEAASSGPTVVMLELETGTDDVRIVDAPVDTRGDTDPGVVACVQQVLHGQRFPAPGAQPGARHRVPYPVMR